MSPEGRDIQVRPARADEFDEAGSLAVRAFSRLRGLLTADNWPQFEKAIRFTTAEDTVGELFVAVLAGEVVGSVRYTGPGHGGHIIYPDRFAYIRSVAVSLDYPRCGIGRKLTEACIEAARRDGAEAVGLHVADANGAARSLYGKLGFQFYLQAPDYFGIPYLAYYMPLQSQERGDVVEHD